MPRNNCTIKRHDSLQDRVEARESQDDCAFPHLYVLHTFGLFASAAPVSIQQRSSGIE